MPRKRQPPPPSSSSAEPNPKHQIAIPEDYAEDLLKFSEDVEVVLDTAIKPELNDYEQRLQAALDSGEELVSPVLPHAERCSAETGLRGCEEPAADQAPALPHAPGQQSGAAHLEEEMQFDFAAELRSAARADAQAQRQAALDGHAAVDGPKTADSRLTPSSRNLLRFGYITALVAADGMSKGEVPGRDMVECFSADRDLSAMLNDYLGELGEFYDLEKHLSPGLKLAGLTVGVYLQVQAAKGKLAPHAPLSGAGATSRGNEDLNNGVSSSNSS